MCNVALSFDTRPGLLVKFHKAFNKRRLLWEMQLALM